MPSAPKRVKVFTAGCFNRIHEAHIGMLAAAKTLGDSLTIVIAHDAHNKKPTAVPASVRLRRLKSLHLADRVIVGDPDHFAASLYREKPQILVLGYDQRLPDAETLEAVRKLGIEVVVLPWYPGKERSRFR